MELKPYQQEVIDDLRYFLESVQSEKQVGEAFHKFWSSHHRTPLLPFPGTAIEPYKNTIPGVPHVCVKVPTAGGKTFIACNALKTIFDAVDYNRKKAVVWLVPSTVILEQTIKSLKDHSHPYRQKINSHFANRVEVYDKSALLQGSSFSALSVSEQLNIFVLSFDSLRAKNKEDRKVYQENGNLQSFGQMIGQDQEISLMRVIQSLNPVLIVDESHNAESDLSVEMLKDLNPCFILDLTATPRRHSNIISFIDAIALKKENMVKLPVIVSNHHDKQSLIHSALQLQHKLELLAKEEEKSGGHYIRPIVLFQAQPKNAADTITFEKIKEVLLSLNIPEEQIKIKTATINEIKGVDLLAKSCPVRYIITINALKEGWDCPFAYILATIADKSSTVDVQQILGRVLRQPYVTGHLNSMLNFSYVMTASAKFTEVLDNVVKALNHAGYSDKDFKALEEFNESHDEMQSPPLDVEVTPTAPDYNDGFDIEFEMRVEHNQKTVENNGDTRVVSEIEETARIEELAWDRNMMQMEASNAKPVPSELKQLVKTYTIKQSFVKNVSGIRLPQFYIRKHSGEIFNEPEQLLNKEDLLEGFQLSKSDSNITFDDSSELFKVDLDATTRDHTPSFIRIDGRDRQVLQSYLFHPANKTSRIKNFTHIAISNMADLSPISQSEIKKYLQKLFEDFTEEQFADFYEKKYSYSKKIEGKIKSLSEMYAEKIFQDYMDTDKIFIKSSYEFPKEIIPGPVSKSIAGSLYEREGSINSFEEKVITDISVLQNIIFWTRNGVRQFKINGFINHYPDFIVHTSRGKTILMETKGDDRDNSDSEAKLRLGKAWEKAAGNNFKYFMVFDKNPISGAHRLDDFLKLVREL